MDDVEPTSRSKRRRANPPEQDDPVEPPVDLDDTCPICHLLVYRPVTTKCSHTLCEFCMATWAEVSVTSQMTILGLDVNEPIVLPPGEIETKCPMCRTLTAAKFNPECEARLKSRYPAAYNTREAEAMADGEGSDGEAIEAIEQLTLYIGNEHRTIRINDPDSVNNHEWKFFIRTSRPSIIEEVQVFLHPTFRNPKVVIQNPPYEIIRLGWGVFTIYANVILRAGYSWVNSEAEDTEDGGRMGKLGLEWTLDFQGRGTQGRLRLKVKKEKNSAAGELERDSERARRAWARQRLRDPDYEPPPSPPPV